MQIQRLVCKKILGFLYPNDQFGGNPSACQTTMKMEALGQTQIAVDLPNAPRWMTLVAPLAAVCGWWEVVTLFVPPGVAGAVSTLILCAPVCVGQQG